MRFSSCGRKVTSVAESEFTPIGPPEVAVTVTTVLYNSEASLPRYAEGLAPALERGMVRVIVVDNASPDGSAALLRRLLSGVEVISNEGNLGFAVGCNRAWPSVESRYWMLINPDVEADAAGIGGLVEWMDAHPGVGLASPRLRAPAGEEEAVARAQNSLKRLILIALRLHKFLPRRLRSRWLLPGGGEGAEIVEGWVPGAALIARSEAVAEVGPLDESLFMYGEDREWCWRMARAGWAIGVCREVEFVHWHGASARATWDESERTRREVAGQLGAGRQMHGRLWVSTFGLLAGLILFVESMDPRRRQVGAMRRMRARLYLRYALSSKVGI